MAGEEIELSEPRYLTVGYQLSDRRPRGAEMSSAKQIPQLRLSGKWLDEAGYGVGQKVKLRLLGRGIIIMPVD